MIVYYYGGTSPTNRALEFSYSMHMYAALGYVVYTLNPSGTTGFGQEFAARHVNAWETRPPMKSSREQNSSAKNIRSSTLRKSVAPVPAMAVS